MLKARWEAGLFVCGKPFSDLCPIRKNKHKNEDMKWLTLDKIKAQLRIDPSFTLEDEILTMYGESAEDSVLDIIRRSYTEVMEKYGTVPTPLVHASLMLVDLSYKERGPVSSQNLYQVPYAVDFKLKPYMKLSDEDKQTNNTQYGKHCNL